MTIPKLFLIFLISKPWPTMRKWGLYFQTNPYSRTKRKSEFCNKWGIQTKKGVSLDFYRRVVTVTVEMFDDSEAQSWFRKILFCNPSCLTKKYIQYIQPFDSMRVCSMYTYIDILQQLVWIIIRGCTLCMLCYMCNHIHI